MAARRQVLAVADIAPAKLNLRLEVLGRRADGYHEVATLLHRIDLADEIAVSVWEDSGCMRLGGAGAQIAVTCRPQAHLGGPANLAHAAASAWINAWLARDPARWPLLLRVEIAITKRIPIAAGLGGGSADAAAVLRCLQALDPLPAAELQAVAASLGSDVPFCLAGGAAVGRGRGERLVPVTGGLEQPILLGVPGYGIASRDAFRWWDEIGQPRRDEPCRLAALEAGRRLDLAYIVAPGFVRNDLTQPVVGRHPEIGELVQGLTGAGALVAEMTGSGSAVYGVFAADDDRATRAAASLAERYPRVAWQLCRFRGDGQVPASTQA